MVTVTPNDTMQQVMTDPAVEATLPMVAAMAGLTQEMTTRIVVAGLPLMANVANGDPWVFKAMYAQSLKPLPAMTAEVYAKQGKSAPARRAMAADFTRIYGEQAESINRDAAGATSTTEEQAGQVLAAMMPALVRALRQANVNANEMGFWRHLRNLNA